MSLFIELIKTIAEAIEESRGTQRPNALPRPVAGPTREFATSAEETVAQAAQRTHARSEAARTPARTAEVERLRTQAIAARAQAVTQVRERERITRAAKDALPRAASSPERVARLLREPTSLRDLVVLKEILDRPLALRPGRR
jgi:hypothetical protein